MSHNNRRERDMRESVSAQSAVTKELITEELLDQFRLMVKGKIYEPPLWAIEQ